MPFSGDGLRRTSSHHELNRGNKAHYYPEPDTPGRAPPASQWLSELRSDSGGNHKDHQAKDASSDQRIIRAVLAYACFVLVAALVSVWYFLSNYSKP